MEWKVEESGKTVGALLKERGVSTTLVRRLKRTPSGITLDGEHVTVRRVAEKGQILKIEEKDLTASENVLPRPGALDTVFEDGYLLIVNKPFGMPVHPSRGHFEDTLANIVAGYFQSRGEARVFRAVNRLDSGTGGLMCIAKDAYCAEMLSADLAGKKIRRVYEAVLCGLITQDEGVIDKPIGRLPGFGIKRGVVQGGEKAVTRFKVTARGKTHTRAEIELLTGRTHQIRVHFSDMGHPVWGDFMYGKEEDFRGLALFSKRLELTHPVTKDKLAFELPLPGFFDEIDDFVSEK